MYKISSAVQRILMCRPTYFKVEYSINPWMDPDNKVNSRMAMHQWDQLKTTLEKCQAEVVVMEPVGAEYHPDLVFTANAAIIRGQHAYLANFHHPERRAERVYYGNWFRGNGFFTHFNPDIAHEGTGDALWAGKGYKTLFSGVGPRSKINAIEDISEKLGTPEDPVDVKPVHLVDERFYHLDTCFCPLDDGLAMYFPRAFDESSKKLLCKHMELLPVSEKEACQFACNAVVIEKNVIMHQGNEETAKMLERSGYKVHFVDMSEFIKSGGSAKCCTLRIA